MMAHKRAWEALDWTLNDLRNDSRCSWGAVILLSGDFCQTLPVLPRSTGTDEINACLKSSNLWHYVKKLQLTTNMGVELLNGLCAPSNCWISVMVVFLPTNRKEWYHFLRISAISFHRKMSSSTKYSWTIFITTKITNVWVSEQFWWLRTKMW